MKTGQHIFRVRRNYNRWVADQTLEDYSLRFTANSARRWSAKDVAITAIGAISFLALEAIGGSLTLQYGFSNTVIAATVSMLVIALLGIPICYHAAKNGIDIDLLTRGAGFGYMGSTITSLIYAGFTFIFFAIEAAIMAMALKLTLNIPLSIGYFISAIVIIPMVTYGITFISKFQRWTQPFWIFLQLLPLIVIVVNEANAISTWTHYEVSGVSDGSFDIVLFGLISSVIFSLVAQIGEQVDFLRFLPDKKKNPTQWMAALLTAGPGWSLIGLIKILIGSFLAWLCFSRGLPTDSASDPTTMYHVAFSYLTTSPNILLLLVAVFVIISQIKINVTNAYAGSIAWSNFFSRVTRNHPGRVVWLVFNVFIALILMELGIYKFFEETLSLYAIVALAWMGTLVADLVINLPLGLRPKKIDFKRSTLYDINPVGVGSMLIATSVGVCLYSGLAGPVAAALASYATLLISLIVTPAIAWYTKGRYYIARSNSEIKVKADAHTCCICDIEFEHEDMSFCPAYCGAICSLCCSLDSRCNDMCKSNSRYPEQFSLLAAKFIPQKWVGHLNSKTGHFISMILFSCAAIAGFLTLLYLQLTLTSNIEADVLREALWKSSFILMIIAGVLCWVFVLIHDSHRVSQEETRRQTRLLQEEIHAHIDTDKALQDAKETAEAANQAKNRYLSGISHELRSPLNSLLGYAQILEKDQDLSSDSLNSVTIIRRSGEYLADLIEGLLDISKIEAGKLEIVSSEVNLPAVLDQIVSMFTLQASEQGIELIYEKKNRLPEYIRADEKHLRQILINLLSNAIKFTRQGKVIFAVSYRSETATFTVQDSGCGIAISDLERIFNPFEQAYNPAFPHPPGTGLGLTITKLLCDIMGGDISVSSELGKGSIFKVQLHMGSIINPAIIPASPQEIEAYLGERKELMIVDDDAVHRKMMRDILEPLGFNITEAINGMECLNSLQQSSPHLLMVDITMPGMTGLELARVLRKRDIDTPILFISANVREGDTALDPDYQHWDYITKPINVRYLLEIIGASLHINWVYTKETSTQTVVNITREEYPSDSVILTLKRMADLGYVKGITSQLDQLEAQELSSNKFISHVRRLADQNQFSEINRLLNK